MQDFPTPPRISLGRKSVHRIVPSCFPPIDLFEGIYESDEEREIAFAIEGLTNPRLRQEVGEISVIPSDQWVTGPGSTPVMAAFTHIGRPSRFTDGAFGIYYAACDLPTAIAETSHHQAIFRAQTDEPDHEFTMRVYTGTMKAELNDLSGAAFAPLLDPDDISSAQNYGAQSRAAGENGLYCTSVRHAGGSCIAALQPKAVGIPRQTKHLRYLYRTATKTIESVFEIRQIL